MSRRLILHIVIAVIAWILFGYYWSLVARRQLTENTVSAVQILLILVLAIWGLTGLWVQHNRRRYAGRPDRRTRRSASGPAPETDAIGQVLRIEGDPRALARAPIVEIEVDGETGEKVFRVAELPAGEVRQ